MVIKIAYFKSNNCLQQRLTWILNSSIMDCNFQNQPTNKPVSIYLSIYLFLTVFTSLLSSSSAIPNTDETDVIWKTLNLISCKLAFSVLP